jgi:uncharacterized protein
MAFFGKKSRPATLLQSGRFELAQDGHIATLEYTLSGDVLTLIETEVPPALRGSGIARELAKTALDWARANHKKVDVLCPFVAGYVRKHPEYADLLLH